MLPALCSFRSLLATHYSPFTAPTQTKQTTYSLSLTNSNNVLYWSSRIGHESHLCPHKPCASAAQSLKVLQDLQSHPGYYFIKIVIP